MYSFRDNWEMKLRICHTAPCFNPYLFTISLKLKVLFQCHSEITSPTVYGSVAWFPFVGQGKVNRTDSSIKEFFLIGSFFFYICCNLSVAQNILPRQQGFYSNISFFISCILLLLKHLRIFVIVMRSDFTIFQLKFSMRVAQKKILLILSCGSQLAWFRMLEINSI